MIPQRPSRLVAVAMLAIGVGLMTINAGADEPAKKPYRPPTELKLQSGTVLRKVEAQRWEKDSVIVKYVGGVVPVQFRHIANLDADALDAWRDWFAANEALQKTAPVADVTRAVVKRVSGQAFIVTRGAGNYKLGDMRVYAYAGDPQSVLSMFEYASDVPVPAASTRTDADGGYKLDLPAGQHTLVAHGRRLAGTYEENYYWFVPAEGVVNLTNSNQYEPSAESLAMKRL